MKAIETHNSPRLVTLEDGLYIVTSFEMEDGEGYTVTAPLGDGKYHLSKALTMVLDLSARRRVEDGAGLARMGE